MRLNKFLSNSGVASRRKCDEIIAEGKVFVNGKQVTELGFKVNEKKDKVMVEGKVIKLPSSFVYIKLNKPKGYACTAHDEKGRKTIYDLIDCDERLFSVGRLDYDTTGLLLLTNDGAFANLMMHPKNKIDKFYVAKVKGIVTGDEVKTLKKGIKIDNKKICPSRVKLKKLDKKNKTSIIEITIHDGINHEVKRLMEAVGHEVIKLKREAFAFLTLGNLKSGEKRALTSKEVKRLYNIANNK